MDSENDVAEHSAGTDRWVSVDIQLPPEDVPVWLHGPRHTWIGCRTYVVGEGWFWAECGQPWVEDGNWTADVADFDDYEATHWRPLPTLPTATTAQVEPMVIPCVSCGAGLNSVFSDGEWDTMQPCGGCEVQIIASYGSTKFDDVTTCTKFRGVICDDCVTAMLSRLQKQGGDSG